MIRAEIGGSGRWRNYMDTEEVRVYAREPSPGSGITPLRVASMNASATFAEMELEVCCPSTLLHIGDRVRLRLTFRNGSPQKNYHFFADLVECYECRLHTGLTSLTDERNLTPHKWIGGEISSLQTQVHREAWFETRVPSHARASYNGEHITIRHKIRVWISLYSRRLIPGAGKPVIVIPVTIHKGLIQKMINHSIQTNGLKSIETID